MNLINCKLCEWDLWFCCIAESDFQQIMDRKEENYESMVNLNKKYLKKKINADPLIIF